MKKKTFEFTDDEILTIGVVLTQHIEYKGGAGNATLAQDVIDKLSKDLARIYRNRSKRIAKSFGADTTTVVR
jgi:hypothetical protein